MATPRRAVAALLPVSMFVATSPAPAAAQVELTDATVEAHLLCSHDPNGAGILYMTGGAGVGDFNRDGYADVYAVTGGFDTDKLFINDGDGTFTESGPLWGLTDTFVSNAVAVGDINGDGWLDIYVTVFGANRLYRNNGDGTFTDIAASAGVDLLPGPPESTASDSEVFGAAFGDYDLDGDLDLMVGNWQSCCYFDCAGCGSGNRLYRNNGDETFTDVTEEAIGSAALAGVYGFQPCFADMDGDLYPELLISADFHTSRYFVNNGDGTFTDMTVASGTGLDDNGMGQTVFDFDNDLKLDWYVTSIYKDNPQPDDNPGNMLYHALGNHQYEEISIPAGVNDGGWGWGTSSIDLDHDGFLDLVEVNGREAGNGEWTGEQAYLWRNNGDGTFTEIAQDAGFVHNMSGRATVWFDAENDGDIDVLVFTAQGPLYFFRNDHSGTERWLELFFDTSNNPLLPPDGFGTHVLATHEGTSRIRYMDGHPSYLGTSQHMVHFGFGDGAGVLDEAVITWSRGQKTILSGLPLDQIYTIHAPDPADITADGVVSVDDLVELITGWGPVTGPENMPADVDGSGEVSVDDLVQVIQAWGPATPPLD